MSSHSTPGGKPEKTMSSRLLTMKFMQRAAASANTSNSAPSTPPSTKRHTHPENDYDGDATTTPPSQKRQKLSSSAQRHSDASSPIGAPRSADLEAIAIAKEAEDQKRSKAVAKYAAEAGETQWVLNFGPAGDVHNNRRGTSSLGYPYIVSAQSIDSIEDQNQYAQDDESTLSGRQCYGNYKRKKRSQTTNADNENEYEGEFEQNDEIINRHDDNMADPAHVDAVIRRARHNADRKGGKGKGQGKYGGSKEVDLRKLSSISGGWVGGGSGGNGGRDNGRKGGREDRRR